MVAITPLYGAFFGLLLVFLSWRIVELRNKFQVKMGDGGHSELTAATRAQGNLIEYLPTALVLMLMLEFLDFSGWVVHSLGILLIVARLMHLKGINDPSGKSIGRKLGTRLTWIQITVASLLCLAGTLGHAF